MHGIRFLVALALLSLLVSHPAFGQYDEDEEDYGRAGWYLGVGGTAAIDMGRLEFLGAPPPMVKVTEVESAVGMNAALGYRAIPWVAAEFEVEWISNFDVLAGDGVLRNELVAQNSIIALTLNARAYPVTGIAQPYLLFGGGGGLSNWKPDLFEGTQSERGGLIRGGGGLELYLTRNIAADVNITYVYMFGDLANLDYLSIGWGVKYRF